MNKIILLVLMIFMCGVANAQCTNPFNEKYSYADFMNMDFSNLKSDEFNNTCIIGSNFYQHEEPYKDIFPDFVNVEFVKCNLDNVLMKDGIIILLKTSNKQIKIQKDWEYWLVDEGKKPIEPLEKEKFIHNNKSIDPKDIPKEKLDKTIKMEEKE